MTNTVSEAAHIKIIQLIAKELGVGPQQVAAAVALLDEGPTVPFIARYRKASVRFTARLLPFLHNPT